MKITAKLSSIIIAKNEELNIARCINSQANCIDEIIVLVDNSSTDKTFEIAGSFINVTVEKIKWQGYAATKKYGVTKSSNDWILWVDADEELTDELKKELNDFKNIEPEFFAYSIPRKSFFLGKWIKHSGWYPGRVTRLFNKNESHFSDNDVHEHLEIKGMTGTMISDINHYTDPDIYRYFEKFNNYTTLAAGELYKNGKNSTIIDIIFRPAFIFVKMYFIRLGFLDGIHGFILAVFSSAYVFTKYCKLWELKRNGG